MTLNASPAAAGAPPAHGSAREPPTQPVRVTIDVNAEICRESLRVRCNQAFRAFPSLTAVLLVVGFLLWSEVGPRAPHTATPSAWGELGPQARLVMWLSLTFLALCWRVLLCRKIIRQLNDAAPAAGLRPLQRTLFWNSIPLNLAMGSGMWWVALVSRPEIQLFVTLAICFYAIGALINLSSHAPSFELALSFNLGQAILFWLLQGAHEMKITLPLLVIAYLLVTLGRENQRAFARSVRMRFENIHLVRQLDQEKGAVEEALATARAASHAKSNFLAGASHDLRQPLTSLACYATTLEMQVQEEEPRQIARDISRLVETLDERFEELLELARFESGDVAASIATVDVNTVVQRLDRTYRAIAAKKGLQWKAIGLHEAVRTDSSLLQRLIGNLLDNAIKYTQQGGVELRCEVDDVSVIVTVEDTGPGIPAVDHERIFEPYYQRGNRGRKRKAGVGLGLSIVHYIKALLGVELSIESELGRGTRFTLRIPRAVHPIKPHEGVQAGPSACTQSLEPLGLRVWLLDDDESVCHALGGLLRAWACETSCAGSEEALWHLQKTQGRWPDALIADDMLGDDRSGLEIAGECARHIDKAKIIIMTGAAMPDRLKAIEASGFQLMRKPARPADLHARLQMLALRQRQTA